MKLFNLKKQILKKLIFKFKINKLIRQVYFFNTNIK